MEERRKIGRSREWIRVRGGEREGKKREGGWVEVEGRRHHSDRTVKTKIHTLNIIHLERKNQQTWSRVFLTSGGNAFPK